jgi:hypothetical protein
VYDGTGKTVVVTGQLPDEINAVVIYYQNGNIMENRDGSYVTSVIEPGEYYVYVQFVSTSNNYVISGMLEYTFTIKKAIINLNSIERDGDREYIYNGDNQSPSIKNGTIPNHVNVTEQLFSIDANGNRTAVESAVNVGNYVKVVTVTLDDPTRYQLSNSRAIEWAFEISPITIIDIDSLPEDFYIEVPDNDGWYVWREDDSVIENAISNAIFGEYSNHADIYSLMTPKGPTTDKWLTPPDNSINTNTIYDLECYVSVDSNYRIICGGQPKSGRFLIIIKIKFIINNNI